MNIHFKAFWFLFLFKVAFASEPTGSCFGKAPVSVIDFSINSSHSGETIATPLPLNSHSPELFSDLFANAKWKINFKHQIEASVLFNYKTDFSYEYPIFKISFIAYDSSHQVVFEKELDLTSGCENPLGLELFAGQIWQSFPVIYPVNVEPSSVRYQIIIWGGHE